MNLGILYGKPARPLIAAWYSSGALLAAWIEGEVPCSVGSVPAEYTNAVVAYLARHNVPTAIQLEAFTILENKKIMFAGLPFGLSPVLAGRGSGPPPQQYHAVGKGEGIAMERNGISEYERRYILAIRTNDINGAEVIIAAILKMLWGIAKGYSNTRRDGRHDKVAEWEEFNQAVDQALERAHTLKSHVRYLSREQIRQMRDSSTPSTINELANRLARQLTTRAIPKPRRARR